MARNPSPKLHLLIWETLCLPRSKGRLGFKYYSWMNKAMLGKQFWRLAKQPNSILTRTLEAKYLPNNSLLDWNWCWKSICSCKNLPLTLANWRFGSGQDIDKTPDWYPPKASDSHLQALGLHKVSDLIIQESRTWNTQRNTSPTEEE